MPPVQGERRRRHSLRLCVATWRRASAVARWLEVRVRHAAPRSGRRLFRRWLRRAAAAVACHLAASSAVATFAAEQRYRLLRLRRGWNGWTSCLVGTHGCVGGRFVACASHNTEAVAGSCPHQASARLATPPFPLAVAPPAATPPAVASTATISFAQPIATPPLPPAASTAPQRTPAAAPHPHEQRLSCQESFSGQPCCQPVQQFEATELAKVPQMLAEIQRLRDEVAHVQSSGARSGFMQRVQLQQLQQELGRLRGSLAAKRGASSEWLQAGLPTRQITRCCRPPHCSAFSMLLLPPYILHPFAYSPTLLCHHRFAPERPASSRSVSSRILWPWI